MSTGLTAAQAGRFGLSRAWDAGIIAGLASAFFFSVAAQRLIAAGYVDPANLALWNNPDPTGNLGGQWLRVALVWLIKLIPGSNVTTLTGVTVVCAAFFQAFVMHDLIQRGWSRVQAGLSVGFTALHPVMLTMAISGSPLLMDGILVSLAILALDRLEAIGDTQSLILLGLLLAGLILSWPDAIFFFLPLIVLLPWAFKDIQNYNAAIALFVITLAPSLIVLTAVALGGRIFDISFRDLVLVWGSPMHGAAPDVLRASPWLAWHGGHLVGPFCALILLCFLLMPRTIIITVRFAFDRDERSRPVTGIAALLLPPLSGAMATYFWQLSAPVTVIAISLVSVTAWAQTANFRNWERWLWVVSIMFGVTFSWLTPFLWRSPDDQLWRSLLLGQAG